MTSWLLKTVRLDAPFKGFFRERTEIRVFDKRAAADSALQGVGCKLEFRETPQHSISWGEKAPFLCSFHLYWSSSQSTKDTSTPLFFWSLLHLSCEGSQDIGQLIMWMVGMPNCEEWQPKRGSWTLSWRHFQSLVGMGWLMETCEMTLGNRTGLNRSGMQLVLFGAAVREGFWNLPWMCWTSKIHKNMIGHCHVYHCLKIYDIESCDIIW